MLMFPAALHGPGHQCPTVGHLRPFRTDDLGRFPAYPARRSAVGVFARFARRLGQRLQEPLADLALTVPSDPIQEVVERTNVTIVH